MESFGKLFLKSSLLQPLNHPFGIGLPLLGALLMTIMSVIYMDPSAMLAGLLAIGALAAVSMLCGLYETVRDIREYKSYLSKLTSQMFTFGEEYPFYQAQVGDADELKYIERETQDLLALHAKWKQGRVRMDYPDMTHKLFEQEGRLEEALHLIEYRRLEASRK